MVIGDIAMLDIMLTAIWLGLFAAGAITLIRVLPGINKQLEQGKKPWICDKCMSFWLILFGVAGIPYFSTEVLHRKLSHDTFLLAGLAGYAISLFMLRALTEPLGPPPSFGNVPDLIDLDTPEIGGKTYTPPFSDPPPPH